MNAGFAGGDEREDMDSTNTIKEPEASRPAQAFVHMPIVSVLCAARNSVYHTMPALVVYDERRDAKSFPGGTAIIAHPPCRSWSVKTKHQAKPQPGERELGLWCCEQLRQCGGVLEQPAHSEMWAAARFPEPGQGVFDGVWSLEVWQAWWGYPMKKTTWLAFAGIAPDDVETPLRLHPRGGDLRREQVMSKNQRSATTREFAEWLVSMARSCVM